MGLRLRWWCRRWSQEGWRRKSPIHSHICAISLSLKNFSKPSNRRNENPNIKKKKKGKPSTTGWNRSKRCEITPTHTQIRCVKQLKCIKYLRISVKKTEERGGGEIGTFGAWRTAWSWPSGAGCMSRRSVTACVNGWGQAEASKEVWWYWYEDG